MHERLKSARRAAGFSSATEAIKKHAWRGSTYRAHENGQNQYDTITARIYAEAFNTTAGWLLTGEEPFDANPVLFDPASKKIYVIGRIAGGEWIEEKIRKAAPVSESIFPPDSRYPVEAQFDLSVHGESLNRFAEDGDYVRCLDLKMFVEKINDKDLLIIERGTEQGLTEITARRLKDTGSRRLLCFESDSPYFQDTIELDKSIKVTAKVLWQYRQA